MNSPMDMHGKATHYEDPAEKMAEDKMLFGGTGGDGMNGNAGMMDKSVKNPTDPRTTGDGSGHWSHK